MMRCTAADAVRRSERKGQSLPRNPANLSARQQAALDALPTRHLRTVRACRIRLAFQDLDTQPSAETGGAWPKRWYRWATRGRLPPVLGAARTIERRWDGMLRWFDQGSANGLLAGINSLVPVAKAKTRGYRSASSLTAMVDLIAGRRDLQLPPEAVAACSKQRGGIIFMQPR